jgi:hypothetical protein
MRRLLLATTVVTASLTALYAQDPHVAQDPHLGVLPAFPANGTGEVIDLLIVGAEMIEGGRVMFFVPQDARDPGEPIPPPSLIAAVDGKEVRAFGALGKPLDNTELKKRLPTWTAVAVVPADLDVPDPFYMKALNERTVTFIIPKKLLLPMTRAARARRKSDGPRP